MSELNKLLFGLKSIGKSVKGKAVEAGKEKGEEMLEKSSEFLDKAQDIGGDLWNKANDLVDKAKDGVEDYFGDDEKLSNIDNEDIVPGIDNELEALRRRLEGDGAVKKEPLESAADKAKKLLLDTKETAKDVGGDIKDSTEEWFDAAKSVADKWGEEIGDKAADFKGKAKVWIDDMNDKAIADEKAEAEKETPIGYDNLKKDLLGGTESFFDKAARFAKGEYKNKKEGDITIEDNVKSKDSVKRSTKGYKDVDGDGDPFIDDAIILGD